MLRLIYELVRKDMRVFVSDRKAMIISFAVPVVIACFIATLTAGMNGGAPSSKTKVAYSSADRGAFSDALEARLAKSDSVELDKTDAANVAKWVQEGRVAYGVIIPDGFGEKAAEAMGTDSEGPELRSFSDPSRNMEAQITRGALMQAMMNVIVKQKYGAMAGTGKPPFHESQGTIRKAAAETDNFDGIAHAFAGMAVQGLMFWSIESAMVILRERRLGIWRRLRASPVSPALLLLGKLVSGAFRAMLILAVVFGFGAALFHMRIEGSWLGFFAVALGAAVMASSFGLFVAALGKTEQQSRGLSILAVLAMTMLGGAWFPSFLMPKWVQALAAVIPVHWAVDGFDSMMWRAQDLTHALPYTAVLFGFAILFGTIALKRIRWEAEA